MKKYLFLLVVLLLFNVPANSQTAEKDAVKNVVETYLFSEEADERRQTLSEQAKIYSTHSETDEIKETRFESKKRRRGDKMASRQKIIDIEISENAAVVKVETDFSTNTVKFPKHLQFILLLKSKGSWKIVSILMPNLKTSEQ